MTTKIRTTKAAELRRSARLGQNATTSEDGWTEVKRNKGQKSAANSFLKKENKSPKGATRTNLRSSGRGKGMAEVGEAEEAEAKGW